MENYFSERISKRKFSKKEISDKLLTEIIEKAMRAPTCGNMQLYSVIVTREGALKKELEKLHFSQSAAVEGNVILTICADFNRFTRWCELKNADPGYNNFHSFITALTDAVIFAQQIVTIAEINGLGSCYLGTVNYNAKEISDLLNLPDLVVPVACIALGYSNDESGQVERLDVEAILHKEKYRDYSDEEILKFFKSKEEFPMNKEFVKLNEKENLAQIFTDIRYPRLMNEKVSETFINLLKEKKFF